MARIVTFGEIMMRLTPPGCRRIGQAQSFDICFGGGEANVAVSLANYGMDAAFVTRLPHNELADSCLAQLRGFGVDTGHILRGGSRMGIYFLENGAVARGSKVIYDRAGSAIAEIEPGMVDWENVLKGAGWFHWTGITPAISKGAAEVCIEAVETASRLGVKVSCDLNYRKKLWKWGKSASEVMPGLVQHCDLILGNEEDAWMEFGIRPEGFDADNAGGEIDQRRFESVCKALMDRFPKARKVAITVRGSISASHNTWGGVLYDGKVLHQSRRYDITHIVDRVGAGDSFMGGLLYGLETYGDDDRAVEFAAAASALKHTIPGDFNRVGVEEVEALAEGSGAGRVSR
ncbi:MAG: sugar kinase [Bacteroidales bacterium]|nr:sugar kinase [Bacteroidales bacterium]